MVTSSPSVTVSRSSEWNRRARKSFHLPKMKFSGVNRVTSALRMGEKATAKVSGISLARPLGVISPKISTMTVSATVEAVGPYTGPSRLEKNTVPRDAAAMFTMLLPMRMVLSSRSNFSARFRALPAGLSPASDRERSRIRFSDAKAVSDAEKNTDIATNATIRMMVIILSSSMGGKRSTLLSVLYFLPGLQTVARSQHTGCFTISPAQTQLLCTAPPGFYAGFARNIRG